MNTTTTLIYGAGLMGGAVLKHCRANGIEPGCFVDARAGAIAEVDGVRVLTLEDAERSYRLSECEAVVAIHNFAAPVGAIVARLESCNFHRVRTFWQYCRDEAWLPEIPYWLAPHFAWESHAHEIAVARDLLRDQTSRETFDEQIALRRLGAYAPLRQPNARTQYVPEDLPRWPSPLSVIDCGAFDGDTLRVLLEHGYEISDFVAFEPDEKNFAQLDGWAKNLGRGRCIQAGAYSYNGTLSFSGGTGAAAHVDPNGDTSISVMRIDEVCQDLKPGLIKMDIEGAEREALEGARETVARFRPGLAISVYHRPEDLWAIQLQIANWDLDYAFHMRSHAHNGFETVLYAMPQ